MTARMTATSTTKGLGEGTASGHTPGTLWCESSIYDGYAACVVGRVAVDGALERETRTLAHVRNYSDALLYAAAPDMLEALGALLAANIDSINGQHKVWDIKALNAALPAARAALSKILGEQP